MQSTIRSFDLAHLAHLEILTPKPDESLNFFVNVMGMTETARRGESVYLRGWDDYEHHTLKLSAAKAAGMGHFAFRARRSRAVSRSSSVVAPGRDGPTATSDTGRPTRSRRPTATTWSCTGRRSGTRRRPN
jgi:catechol 2,3-dioxygenase-like lactoylglutathione lyase family enzyme